MRTGSRPRLIATSHCNGDLRNRHFGLDDSDHLTEVKEKKTYIDASQPGWMKLIHPPPSPSGTYSHM